MITRIIAAWPSFALIAAYEMLMGQIRQSRELRAVVEAISDGQRVTQAPEGSVADQRGPRDRVQDFRRTAWQWAQANRRPDGTLPSGQVIAAHFARSPRWGRWVKKLGMAGELD